MAKTKADRRADVLKFIAVNPGVPVAAGVNMGKGAKTPRQRWHRFPDAMTVARAIKHATGG